MVVEWADVAIGDLFLRLLIVSGYLVRLLLTRHEDRLEWDGFVEVMF